ncbi:MAG: polyisoprenoid-binding protein, partial [Cyclobacteriaceae bacterium]|nr:polyisoprenoid-binding protein [Cyclobacteriaceae bacterium]
MKTKILTIAFVLAFTWGMAQETWVMDKDHTEIQFNVTHLVISEVSGNFKEFDGKVLTNQEDFAGADIEFTANVASIDTDNERRDNHLKSEDFFAAEIYPHVKFAGKLFKNGENYRMQGDLTMRDVTSPVEFDVKYNGTVTDPWGNKKAGFKITGTVDR